MKWLVLLVAGILVLVGASIIYARQPEESKINVCHKTGSDSNPYEAIRVAYSAWENGHSKHEGDFLYFGETDDKGQPTDDSWCQEARDIIDNPDTPSDPTGSPTTNVPGSDLDRPLK